MSEVQSFDAALAQYGIPSPDRPIEQQRFTRWGKNARYFAKGFGEGIHFGDYSADISETWFVDEPDKTLDANALHHRQQQAAKARQEAEEERERGYKAAAKAVQQLWQGYAPKGVSAYLERKQVAGYDIGYGEGFIAVPMCDVDGVQWSEQRIYDDGNKRFHAGGRKKGCFYLIGNCDGEAYICEGYATGATIHAATGRPVYVAFDAGNLEPVIAAILKRSANKALTVAADNDAHGEVNTGLEKAKAAAEKYGCAVVFPEFANQYAHARGGVTNNPTDFNDLFCLAGVEEVQRQLLQNLKKPEIQNVKLSSGFVMSAKGLCWMGGDEPEWVCSPIEVLAYTRDEHNENWGRLIRFSDLDGHVHERAIPMEIFSADCNELFSLLLSLGVQMATKRALRNRMADYLQQVNVGKRALCVSRIGWHGEHFILPDGATPSTDAIYLQNDSANFIGYRTAGTLEQWQEHVAIPCRGNSRLVFALSCAFAAPLLPVLHMESGGFNIRGNSSSGKSTALSVAASVCGSSKYVQQWKATGNALEAVAEAYNHMLLPLDELGQVDGREAGEIAYMLANGSGKNRLKAKGGLRRKFEWETLFLSTGEISLADKVREGGKNVQAGMLTRMADIPADAGKGYRLFDTLNGYADGGVLSNHLKECSGKYYGTAIRAYLPRVVQSKAEITEAATQTAKEFLAEYVEAEADGQVRRVAMRFALVGVAGELAIDMGVLPYEAGEGLEAAAMCFQSWLEARGGSAAQEGEEALRQVQAFFEAHSSSRFALMSDTIDVSDQKIINQAGYKRKTADGVYEYYVFPEIFRNELCKGFNDKQVAAELCGKGLLFKQEERKYTSRVRLPIGRKPVYHIAPAILVESEAQDVEA